MDDRCTDLYQRSKDQPVSATPSADPFRFDDLAYQCNETYLLEVQRDAANAIITSYNNSITDPDTYSHMRGAAVASG